MTPATQQGSALGADCVEGLPGPVPCAQLGANFAVIIIRIHNPTQCQLLGVVHAIGGLSLLLGRVQGGKSIAARIAIMAITTNSFDQSESRAPGGCAGRVDDFRTWFI